MFYEYMNIWLSKRHTFTQIYFFVVHFIGLRNPAYANNSIRFIDESIQNKSRSQDSQDGVPTVLCVCTFERQSIDRHTSLDQNEVCAFNFFFSASSLSLLSPSVKVT